MSENEKKRMSERIALFRRINGISDILNNAARDAIYGAHKQGINMELIEARKQIDRLLNERVDREYWV